MSALLTLADALATTLLAQAPPPSDLSLIEKILERPEAIFFVFLAMVIIVPTVARIWVSMKTKEWEASLKHSMLERGMSAHEIQMVLDAGASRGGSKKQSCSNPGTVSNFSQTADYGPQANSTGH